MVGVAVSCRCVTRVEKSKPVDRLVEFQFQVHGGRRHIALGKYKPNMIFFSSNYGILKGI
jgi:hypothetical protein